MYCKKELYAQDSSQCKSQTFKIYSLGLVVFTTKSICKSIKMKSIRKYKMMKSIRKYNNT